MNLLARNAKAFGKFQPELRVVRLTGFFVDQILENFFARPLIIAMRVNGGEISRERGDVVIILLRVIRQRGLAQFAPSPGKIKGMR